MNCETGAKEKEEEKEKPRARADAGSRAWSPARNTKLTDNSNR